MAVSQKLHGDRYDVWFCCSGHAWFLKREGFNRLCELLFIIDFDIHTTAQVCAFHQGPSHLFQIEEFATYIMKSFSFFR